MIGLKAHFEQVKFQGLPVDPMVCYDSTNLQRGQEKVIGQSKSLSSPIILLFGCFLNLMFTIRRELTKTSKSKESMRTVTSAKRVKHKIDVNMNQDLDDIVLTDQIQVYLFH